MFNFSTIHQSKVINQRYKQTQIDHKPADKKKSCWVTFSNSTQFQSNLTVNHTYLRTEYSNFNSIALTNPEWLTSKVFTLTRDSMSMVKLEMLTSTTSKQRVSPAYNLAFGLIRHHSRAQMTQLSNAKYHGYLAQCLVCDRAFDFGSRTLSVSERASSELEFHRYFPNKQIGNNCTELCMRFGKSLAFFNLCRC